MRYGNSRILLFNRNGRPLGDLVPRDLLSPPRMVDELNGEHTITIETRRRLEPETRLLWRDGMGTWHEWVIQEPKEHHRRGEYFAVWSLQHDLEGASGTVHWASAEVGTHDPIDAEAALTIALSDQRRWQVGVVDVDSRAGASMYDAQVWSYVKTVARVWGGELSVTIEVEDDRVVTRKVNLLAHVGSETATRRFDWGHDVEDITRTPDPAPYYCRIRPRGGSAKTDNDGIDYSDRCGIEEVEPSGHDYIEDAESAAIFRVLNPDGTYHYPMKTVIYEVTETSTGPDDEELYHKALADLHNHTRPRVTYEASVRQFARAGLDYRGVTLGDEIQIVDRGFSDEGSLRLSGRVIRIEQDLPVFGGNPDNTELTIGFLQKSIGET